MGRTEWNTDGIQIECRRNANNRITNGNTDLLLNDLEVRVSIERHVRFYFLNFHSRNDF